MADHPVAAKIAAKFGPELTAQLDAHYEELISDLNGLERLGARKLHQRLLEKVPLGIEIVVNGLLDDSGATTIEEVANKLFL